MQAHPASVDVMMMSQVAHNKAVPTFLYAAGKPVLDPKGSCCQRSVPMHGSYLAAGSVTEDCLAHGESHPIILN